jgi:hypothetical protein
MRRTRFELAAASTNDFDGGIGGVNSGFHDFPDCRIAHRYRHRSKQNARSGDEPAAGVFCVKNKA